MSTIPVGADAGDERLRWHPAAIGLRQMETDEDHQQDWENAILDPSAASDCPRQRLVGGAVSPRCASGRIITQARAPVRQLCCCPNLVAAVIFSEQPCVGEVRG
jgi:hypothetical protein